MNFGGKGMGLDVLWGPGSGCALGAGGLMCFGGRGQRQ